MRLQGLGAQIVGLRPGEKLEEELIGADEAAEPSGTRQILRVCPQWKPRQMVLSQQVRHLEELAASDDAQAVIEQLRRIVPTYRQEGVECASTKTRNLGWRYVPSPADRQRSRNLEKRRALSP